MAASTDNVLFETTKTCFDTTRSHINRVPVDSNWEAILAAKLEEMPEVVSYAKNQGLILKIPYTFEGRAANYVPDFLIRLRDADSTGPDDLLTLVLEVSGEAKKEKQAKTATAQDLWVPAVNNWGERGAQSYAGRSSTMVSTLAVNAQNESSVRADLFGEVKLNFVSEILPLDKLVDPVKASLVQRNAPALRPAAPAPQPASPPPAPAEGGA